MRALPHQQRRDSLDLIAYRVADHVTDTEPNLKQPYVLFPSLGITFPISTDAANLSA